MLRYGNLIPPISHSARRLLKGARQYEKYRILQPLLESTTL